MKNETRAKINEYRVAMAAANGISIGAEAKADGQRSTAIGRGAIGKAAGATALGSAAQATGTNSVAVGSAASASNMRSVAVGSGANADGHRATALGTNTKASGPGAVALGNGSEATNAKLWNRDNQGATVGNITLDDWAGDKTMGEVSIGTKGNERAISNVAAGEVSKTSTEAVNGSQLYSAARQISANNRAITANAAGIAQNAQAISAVNAKADTNTAANRFLM